MDLSEFSPHFLGSYGENNSEFEDMFLEFFRDHVYWRRNFHPEDIPPISTLDKHKDQHLLAMAKTKQELHKLSAALKRSVPFSNPRYIGHMASDLLLPGVLAQMITTLYNPNNVSEEAAPVTVDMELEVGTKLASMFGYNLEPTKGCVAWGHLTSGGTVANYQSLWLFRSLKYYPLAVKRCGELINVDFLDKSGNSLSQYSVWQLMNLSIDDIVAIRHNCLNKLKSLGAEKYNQGIEVLREQRFEALGPIDFFNQYPELKQPIVIVPVTAHYSWEKSLKILGMGTNNLWKAPVDERMRLNPQALKELVDKAQAEQRPILAVVGVLGTTEFGTIDPIGDIVKLRDEKAEQGYNFFVHVDAAWGGYLSALFRDANNQLRPQQEIAKDYQYFPSDTVYQAFSALGQTDSITVDPHKLGYIPYGCGAFIARNKDICGFVVQEAAYVFDKNNKFRSPEPKLNQLGQYIMEGSKPGAAAAASYVSHNVLPLNADAFGRISGQTIKATEIFYQEIERLADKLKGKVNLLIPMEPDTNLLCLTFNPVGNKSLRKLNEFTRQVFESVKVNKEKYSSDLEFIGSYTSIFRKNLDQLTAQSFCERLDIDNSTFVEQLQDETLQDNAIFVFRHTLMNPWLCDTKNGENYIQKYLTFLEQQILIALE